MNIDIDYIAKLARLKIESEKHDKFQKELGDIIAMCENLPPLTGSLKPDVNTPMTLREDIICPSLTRADMLENAPQTQAGCVVVPKTVE